MAQFRANPECCRDCRRLHCAAVFSCSLPPFGNVSLISPALAVVKQQLQRPLPGQGRVAELEAPGACWRPNATPATSRAGWSQGISTP